MMKKEISMEDRKPVLQSITGMRGIACLFIVCYHYFCLSIDDPGLGMEALPFGPRAEFFFVYAKNAVELFFMLAGFLTAYHYRERITDLSFGAYFKKHYGKLLIPSLLVNAWALLNELALPSSDIAITPLRCILSVLMINTGWFTSYSQTGLPVNSTMWFIDVLLLCYLLYYAIRKLAKNRYAYVCVCTLIALLGWICLEHTPKLPFLWSFDGRGYAPFFIGVLLCEFQQDAGELLRKKVTTVWITLVLGVLIARLCFGFDAIFGTMGGTRYVRYFEFIAAPGIILAALNLPPMTIALEWKPIVWLGGLATALYYVHNNVMQDYAILNNLTGRPVSFSAWPIFVLVIISIVPLARLYCFFAEKSKELIRSHRGGSQSI